MPTTAELLDFAQAHPRPREELIRSTFGIPPAQYYQRLFRAIDTREAEELNPLLVHRLRRIRDDAAAKRARRLAG